MSPPRHYDGSETTEPLHPTPSALREDDVNTDAETRRDDVPVLACENGACSVQPLPAKKAQYLKNFRLPRRLCSLRCREVLILSLGVVLTCVALGLIVAGALRSPDDQGAGSAFLHVSSLIKHLSSSKETAQTATTDQIFTFEQLLLLNNYALNKPTQQSSIFLEVLDIPELDGEADFAVDGSVSTCARTGLHDLEVYVGNNENVTDNTLCTRLPGIPHLLDVRVVCDHNLSGRYVGVILRTRPGKPESLIICEALVYLM